MADLQGCSALDLVPLGSVVDVDSMDGSGGRPAEVTASFEYCGRRVTMTPTHVRIDA